MLDRQVRWEYRMLPRLLSHFATLLHDVQHAQSRHQIELVFVVVVAVVSACHPRVRLHLSVESGNVVVI